MTPLVVLLSIWLEFILVYQATLAVLRAWFFGSVLEFHRAKYQVMEGWRGKLASCPLCLSYHIAFWLWEVPLIPVKIYLALMVDPGWWASLVLTPIIVFAASGVAMTTWHNQYHNRG